MRHNGSMQVEVDVHRVSAAVGSCDTQQADSSTRYVLQILIGGLFREEVAVDFGR